MGVREREGARHTRVRERHGAWARAVQRWDHTCSTSSVQPGSSTLSRHASMAAMEPAVSSTSHSPGGACSVRTCEQRAFFWYEGFPFHKKGWRSTISHLQCEGATKTPARASRRTNPSARTAAAGSLH
jgi:hypothetical protein